MPTGYTANVPDGITFEQFVWQCARGMGALVMMRDEPTGAPIPERFEPSDYNAKRLQEATDELARLRSLTPEQMQAECEAKHAKSEAQKKKRLAENEAQLAAYRAMLDRVLAWVPPTKLLYIQLAYQYSVVLLPNRRMQPTVLSRLSWRWRLLRVAPMPRLVYSAAIPACIAKWQIDCHPIPQARFAA